MGKSDTKHGVSKANVYAKSLQDSKYRQRIVLDKKKYNRKKEQDRANKTRKDNE